MSKSEKFLPLESAKAILSHAGDIESYGVNIEENIDNLCNMNDPVMFIHYKDTVSKYGDEMVEKIKQMKSIKEVCKYINSEDRFTKYEKFVLSYYAMICFAGKKEDRSLLMFNLQIFGSLYKWSKNKQVYSFDSDFITELYYSKKFRLYPELMKRLPYPDVYIDFSGFQDSVKSDYTGAFVHVEVKEDNRLYVSLQFTVDKLAKFSVVSYSLFPDELGEDGSKEVTMENIFKRLETYGEGKVPETERKIVYLTLNALMYLSSEKPDIEESELTKRTYRPYTSVRNKFSEVRKWEVGVRFGARFRKHKEKARGEFSEISVEAEGKERKIVRPHIRCAHWHTYRCGKGKKERRVVWLEPVFVNSTSPDDMTVVIHNVE